MNDLDAAKRQQEEALLAARFGADAPATREFKRARTKAFLNDVVAFLRGYENHLLEFGRLSDSVAEGEPIDLGLQEVPLDKIRGSVDRYRDFDLAFLPRHSALRDRWERVATARNRGLPMPPVELYKIGDIYFVRDGHHRVSVCRARGDKTIQAHVLELTSRVPLHPKLKPDDLPAVEAYADFLRVTGADKILPDVDLRLTQPKLYARLLRHIALFRYLNRKPGQEPREWREAVLAWYEQLYKPVVEIIEKNRVMKRFPDRTPTDLYLWVVTNFRRLKKRLPREDEIGDIEDDLHFYLAPFINL